MNASLKAEVYKFFSIRGCTIGLSLSIVLPIVVFLYLTMNQNLIGGPGETESFLIAIHFISIGIIVFSACFWGEEYQEHMIRTTLLSVSKRNWIIASKLLVLSLVVFGVVVFTGSIIATIGKGLTDSQTLLVAEISLKRVLFILISDELMAFIASSVSILLQSTYLSIALLFSLQVGGSQMLLTFTSHAQYLPDLAVFNLFHLSEQSIFLTKIEGILVQGIWAASLIIISMFLFFKRDVR